MAKGKRKNKKTRVVALRRPDRKETRIAPGPPLDGRPLWAFHRFDNAGDWPWARISEPDALLIMRRLRDYNGMTWVRIQQAGHSHPIEPSRIAPRAQARLRALRLYEIDSVFSLSMGGRRRLWGIRYDSVFFALWWDPQHEVYPTEPK